MSLSSQRFSAAYSSLITFHRHCAAAETRRLKSPSVVSLPTAPPHFRVLVAKPKPLGPNLVVPARCSRLGVYDSERVVRRNGFNFGSLLSIVGFVFLSIVEFVCRVCSAFIAVFFVLLGGDTKVFGVWELVIVVGGVLVGALIRRRQWRMGVESFNLVHKIEKLEHDVKSMKDPIAETAALAQKNSEATRALTAQKDNLEKELCEIHNVMLIMQEQQHKQLELILAIGKGGNLFNDEEVPEQERDTNEKPQPDEGVRNKSIP